METTEFFTLAFTLACTVGPAIGLGLAIGSHLFGWLGRQRFAITIGREDNHDH